MSVIEAPRRHRGRPLSEISHEAPSTGAGTPTSDQLAALRLRPGLGSEDIAAMIARAMQFPIDTVLSRYMKEHQVSAQTALLHERELKRFLVCGAVFDNPIGMRGEVDHLWHAFVLFTRDYRQFCQDVCGTFIDHVPLVEDVPSTQGKDAGYVYFHAAYRTLFGQVPPTPPWPPLDGAGMQAHDGRADGFDTVYEADAFTAAGASDQGLAAGAATSLFLSDDSCSVCVGRVDGRE